MLDRSRRSSVYRVTNLLNGDDYVGISVDPKRRWNTHKCEARAGSQVHFHRALMKHGISNFLWEVLVVCIDYDTALTMEKLLRFLGMGKYNMTDGGEGMLGRSPSQETRKKSADARRGAKRSPEARAAMSAAKKGKPARNRGIPVTEEQKRKQSQAMQGRQPTEQALAILAQGRKIPYTDERKQAQSLRTKAYWQDPKNRDSRALRTKPRNDLIAELYLQNMRQTDISDQLGVSVATVNRVIGKFKRSQQST